MPLGLYLAELLKRMERGPGWHCGTVGSCRDLSFSVPFTRAPALDCLGYWPTARNCWPAAGGGPCPKQNKSSSVGARL